MRCAAPDKRRKWARFQNSRLGKANTAQHSTAQQQPETHTLSSQLLAWLAIVHFLEFKPMAWHHQLHHHYHHHHHHAHPTLSISLRAYATMRATSFALALVALILSFIAVASANQVAPSPLPLEKRQAAAGGGAGVATTYTGVQIISGYNPPPSSVLPSPTVSRGTILTTIPGYGNSSNSGNALNQGSGMGSSSGALSLLRDTHLVSGAAASATFMCVAVVAAAAVLL